MNCSLCMCDYQLFIGIDLSNFSVYVCKCDLYLRRIKIIAIKRSQLWCPRSSHKGKRCDLKVWRTCPVICLCLSISAVHISPAREPSCRCGIYGTYMYIIHVSVPSTPANHLYICPFSLSLDPPIPHYSLFFSFAF